MNSSLIQHVLLRRIVAMLFICTLGMVLTQTTARGQDRSLSFYNIHTKESLAIVYKRNGSFDQEALQKLNYFMRDWRRNATIKIDPALFDLIWEMYRELGAQKPIHVICGHRSSATNEGLRRTRGGQAKASRHITGQAIDLHFPDVSVKQLRNSALIRERGGVGYYPTSSIPFIHVDTGNVRHWPRLPRQELAILFPNGGSKHVPTDGRPLTKADFRMALAALQERGGELPTAVRARMRPDNTPSTVLASLTAPANTTPVAAVIELPEQKPRPTMMLASLGAPFPKFGGGGEPAAQKPPSLTTPVVSARAEQTSARPDLDSFTNDILKPNSQPALRQDDDDGEVEYDEDDHPDENAFQPFPILPFMSDTPVASMDMSDPESDFTLAKVHLQFNEPKEMLDTRFKPGLQFAELFWAQRFRGGAVNTALRRLDRDAPATATAAAPAPLPAAAPVRTAQRAAAK